MATATPVETVDSEKMIAIVLYPERERPAKSGPYRFPVSKTGAKSVKTEMSMDGAWIHAGPNFVTLAAYEQMKTSPGFVRCVDKKIIEVVEQDSSSKATGTTADFNLDNAFKMIEVAVDEDWLQRSLTKDERRDVQGWISEKISELQESAKKE